MKTSNKLLAAISSFAIASVALVGSTFAWFTLGTTGEVTAISGTMQASSGLKMGYGTDTGGVATVTWDSSFTFSEITGVTSTLTTTAFSPITCTKDTITLMHNAVAQESATVGATSAILGTEIVKADNGGFIQFDLYFYADSEAYVGLDTTTTSISAANAETSTYTEEQRNLIKNAMRVGFYGDNDIAAAGTDIYRLFKPSATATIDAASQVKLGAPQDLDADGFYDYSTLSGSEGEYAFGQWTTVAHGAAGDSTTPYPNAFNTLTANHSSATTVVTTTGAVAENALFAGEMLATSGSNHLLHLEAGKTAKVTVCVYAEGFDADCANYISSSSFTLNLGFTR